MTTATTSPVDWRHVAGCSITGSVHRRRGHGCQDAFRSEVSADGALVLAVADGAGSRERSALGAHLAVDAACRVLGRAVPSADAPPERWAEWARSAAASVVHEYERVAAPSLADGQADALATTLAAAVVRPPWAVFVGVGDCFGAVLTRDGGVEDCHLVLPPAEVEFLGGARGSAAPRGFALWDEALSGVVLASDGCLAAALDHPSVHGLPAHAGPQPAAGFYRAVTRATRSSLEDREPLFAAFSEALAERTVDDATVLCCSVGSASVD
ncbi:MAG TPA: protein phosphatase 2C domain-containing protein [Actinospica sp.]|nr:protein phosphatase 2C domain-containing protein [Actinospica sp.]